MGRTSHLSLLEKCKPYLGPSASQDQTLVLAGLAFSSSSDELERPSSPGHGHFLGCSRKTPCPTDVNSWSEALLHQDVINLIVVFSIWAVACPSSGWFVRAKGVCQYLVVKGYKFYKSETSLICLDIAVGSTNLSPFCLCILPNFSIPIPLYSQNVLLWCLVYDFLELLVEVVDLTVIMTRCWCIKLYDGDIIQPHTHDCPLLHWNKPCVHHLWYLTKVFPCHLAEPHYVPVIPAHCMSQLFKFPSWPQSSHIPWSNRDVLPTSNFLDLWYTVAYLSPTSRCLTVGAVIVIPGCDRSGIKVLLVFIIMVFLGHSSAWRSPSLSMLFILTTAEIHGYCMARLGHEHMAVDSKSSSALTVVLSPPLIDPSGWETHGGGSVLFPPNKSLTCPLPII